MESIVSWLDVSGDNIGYIENNTRYKFISIFLKSLTALLSLGAETFHFYFLTINREKFNKNATFTVSFENDPRISYKNKSLIANVNLDEFNNNWCIYLIIFLMNLFFYLIYGIYECYMWEYAIRFMSVLRVLFLEVPLLIIGILILQAQSIIDWQKQTSFVATHCMFFVNIIGCTYVDMIMKKKKREITLRNTIFIIGTGPVLACITYAPVSIYLFGFIWGKTALYDTNKANTSSFTALVFFFLLQMGRCGQVLWIVVAPWLAFKFLVCEINSQRILARTANHIEEEGDRHSHK